MYKLKKLSNINQIIKNLDLTNSILVQISMFLNDNDEFSYINDKDQRIIRKESDQKLVNDLINILLNEKILTNKELYEKTNQILQDISDDNPLKENILKVFQNKPNEISNEENRWEELKLKNLSNQNENQIKYKNLDGFVPIYEKPGGIEQGDLNFKLISKPANSKEIEKYSNSWEKSKYFNVWMRKEAEHPKEIYMTKLVSLFYQGQENLYKVRSVKQKNQELQQILVKFIPNVRKYDEFEKEIQLKNDEEFNQIREKIDEKALLKLLIANFLIQNVDVNTGNILVKEKDDKIQLIPIDFSYFSQKFEQQISKFTTAVKNQNFEEAKKFLIEYGRSIVCFENQAFRNENIIQSEIDLDYQLSRISDEEFKEIITGMFSKYDEMKSMFDEQKKIISQKIKDLETRLESLKEDIEEIENKLDLLEKEISNIEEIEEKIDRLKRAIDQIQDKLLNQQDQEESRPPSPKLKLDSLDESKADDLFPEITD